MVGGVAPSEAMDVPGRRLSIGATGQGRRGVGYRLIAPIARGGMGELYLAEQVAPGGERVQVIIKRLLDNLRDDSAHVAMFRSEAEHLSLLDHKNIVRVLDVPEIAGARCLALEYVRGRSVAQILDRARYVGRRIPPEIAVYVVTEVLEGLDHVHRARLADGQPVGLVHRDVTPGNLLVSFDGDVKITDFGISKSLMSKVSTTVGIVKGKARYLAPEQILGEPASPRSDMFSAACVIYEMLTSIPLFDRPSVPKTLTAIVHGDVPDLRAVLPIPSATRLIALIGRTLAVQTEKRHERASELAAELRAAAGAELGPLVGRAAVSAYMRQLFEGLDESWEQAPQNPEEVESASNPVVAFEELIEPVPTKATPGERSSGERSGGAERSGADRQSGERPAPLLRAASIADADALEPLDTDPPPPLLSSPLSPAVAPPPIAFTPSPESSPEGLGRDGRKPEPTLVVERARGRAAPTEVVVRTIAPVPQRIESVTPVFDGEEATLAVAARSPLDERGQSVTVPGAPPAPLTSAPRVVAHDDVATQAEIVLGGRAAPRADVRVSAPDDHDDSTEAYDSTDTADAAVSPREPTRIERNVVVRRTEATVVSDRLVGTVPARSRPSAPPRGPRASETSGADARRSGGTNSNRPARTAWWSRRPLLALASVFVLGAGTGVGLTALLRRADGPPPVVLPANPPGAAVEADPAGAVAPREDPLEAEPPPVVPEDEAADPEEEAETELGAQGPEGSAVADDRATLDVVAPQGGRVRVDGRLVPGRIPLRGVELEPGRRVITVELRKRRREITLEVEPGDREVLGSKEWKR